MFCKNLTFNNIFESIPYSFLAGSVANSNPESVSGCTVFPETLSSANTSAATPAAQAFAPSTFSAFQFIACFIMFPDSLPSSFFFLAVLAFAL